MIPILKKIVNWFTNNIRVVTISIITLLTVTIFVLGNLLKDKNLEVDRLLANMRAYELIASNTEKQNRVLLLTINELNNSKDSLVQEVNEVRLELKIKDKNLTQIDVINTVIQDTIVKTIEVEPNFETELKPNPLTTITVSRQDSILTAKIDIRNQLILFVEEKKEFKNKYKNGWIRFWHFDWKKIRVRKYQIYNTNNLIKVTDTRIIEINN